MENISELAKMAASGDNSAFEKLYAQTKGGVWFTCINLLKNEENAKDVMQETYITAFERLGSLADYSGVQSWLNKIAANKCKNYIRTVSNSHLAENGEELLENIPDDSLIPEEYVTDIAKRRIIMDIIEKALSEDQYRTIILYYFDEMTAAEIAELMEVHEKTVLYRLKVARQKIKEAIMRYEEENKDKLHGVVFIPTLTRLFRAEAENTPVPNVPLDVNVKIPANTQNVVPSEQAAQAAAQQGGKAMLNTLKAKIIAGACAAVVVGGGVTAGVLIANNAKDDKDFPLYSTGSTGTNTSKPASGNTSKPSGNSGSGTSKPATNPPAPTDRVVYPQFEGLTPVEFKTGWGDEIQPDIISGHIKEMTGSGGFVMLTDENEIVTYTGSGYRDRMSFGITPGITTLDNSYYDGRDRSIVVVNGNTILFKALDNDGEIALSKEGNPRYFSGTLDFGDNIAKVVVGSYDNLYAFDAEGYGTELTNRFEQHSELGFRLGDDRFVSIFDDQCVYYYTGNPWGFYFVDMKVKKLVADKFINEEGKMYYISGGGQISDKEPIDYLAEYTFKDFYTGDSLGLGITEDDTIIVFDIGNRKVLLTTEMLDSTIQNVWYAYNKVYVKTDKGVYLCDFESDSAFKPFDTLNNTGEDIVHIGGKYVLLGNGFVYEIK